MSISSSSLPALQFFLLAVTLIMTDQAGCVILPGCVSLPRVTELRKMVDSFSNEASDTMLKELKETSGTSIADALGEVCPFFQRSIVTVP